MDFFKYWCLLLLLLSFGAQAQENATSLNKHIDVVYLKNGSQFRGYIVEYKPRQYLVIDILGGRQVTFEAKDIRKIRQEWLMDDGISFVPRPGSKPYNFRERGVYAASYLGFLTGTAAWRNELQWGVAANVVAGYRFNRWIGTGIGIGVNNYYPSAGEVVYPVFVEARGYLSAHNVSPYYALAAGYGFTFKNENKNIVETEGGPMINPSLGIRFGGSPKVNFILDFGIKIQKASFIRNGWGWDASQLNRQDMVYKRLTSRLGLAF